MRVAWSTPDPVARAGRLRDTLGVVIDTLGEQPAIRFRGGAIVLTQGAGLRATPGGRLSLERSSLAEPSGPAEPTVPVHPGGIVDLIGVGWATVELGRAVREFAPLEFEQAVGDDLLGARARVARIGPGSLVLLEPSTEGRTAATLARFGEGAGVVYLAVSPGGLDRLAARLRRDGERVRIAGGVFGRSLVVGAVSGATWGPHVVACEPPATAREPARRRARTIAP